MTLLGRLSRLQPDLAATFVAFPVPALISGLLFVWAQLEVAGAVTDGTLPDNPVYLAGAAGFLAAGAGHYFGRGRRWRRGPESLLALVLGSGAFTLAYFGRTSQLSAAFLFAGLVSLLMVSAFLRSDGRSEALWLFVLRLGIASLLASLVGIVFAGGLSAILASIRFLFDLEQSSDGHVRIWTSAMTLVSPIYGLGLAPRDVEEAVELDPSRDFVVGRGISGLVNFVLIPLVLVDALVLHAYALKIAIEGTIPKNQVALMVATYGLVGSAAWLVSWPWRGSGNRLLRGFVEGWFWLTLVPVILLVLAIGQRIAAYGITPDRYAIVLVAIWLSGLSLYLWMWRGRADLRVPLAAFSALTLLASAGPWGANGLSAVDQAARLVDLLEESGSLDAEGRFIRRPEGVGHERERRIASILRTLDDVGGLDRVRPIFAGQVDDPFARKDRATIGARPIAETMGVEQAAGDESGGDPFAFSADGAIDIGIPESSRLLGPISIGRNRPWAGPGGLEASIEAGGIAVELDGRRWMIPANEIEARTERLGAGASAVPIVELGPRITLILDRAFGRREKAFEIETAVLWLVVRDAPKGG